MPQIGMNSEGRGRRGTHRSTFKANGRDNGFLNGPAVPRSCPAAATRTSDSALKGTQPRGMANGYIDYRYQGKRSKSAQTQGGRPSAGRVSCGAVPGVASARASDQTTAERSASAAAKTCRRRNRSRHKSFHRDTEADSLQKCKYLLMPPQEEEDWDSVCFGARPYGPEDVLHFALQDMSLQRGDPAELPGASYNPAAHHPRPVRWSCCSVSSEPGQFADAEE